jgi:hypothetical protein
LPDQAAVVQEVCRNASLNEKIGQDMSCTSSSTPLANPPCPTAVAGRPAHVFFFAANQYKVKVCSPGATVTFGLAQAMPGVGESIDVRASATVLAGTPGAAAEMPFYGVAGSGCDYGAQALTDPAKGQTTSGTEIPSNLATPNSGVPNQNTSISAITPSQVSTNTGTTLRISGSGLSKVTAVGFYRETTFASNRVEPGALPSNSDSTGKSVDFLLPATSPVMAEEGVWYVRVYESGINAAQTGWSKRALVLRVGDPVLSCGSLSSSGNFGALKLPRTDSNNATSNGWMPNNLASGLQSPLSLAVDTQAVAPWTCVDGGVGVIYSNVTGTPTLRPRTNCLTTDTGLTSTATTAGLVTGTPLFPGRLANKATSSEVLDGRACGPGRSSSSRTVLGNTINNDTLSCFLTDPNMKIEAIAKASYTGGAALDPAIFRSPRFCLVPIVNYDPSRGRSFNYSVVDMRPCFITGETATSSYNSQQFLGGTGTNNGIALNSSGLRIETLGVVFFNRNALPNSGANLGDYIGVGPLSVQMVD